MRSVKFFTVKLKRDIVVVKERVSNFRTNGTGRDMLNKGIGGKKKI